MQNEFPHRLIARFAIALGLVVGTDLNAQLPPISGGTRVRLAMSEPAVTLQGTVFSQSADTLLLAGDGGVRAIPLALVSRVSVGGERSHTAGAWHGAKMGALILGGVGAVVFGASYESYDGQRYSADLIGVVAASAFSGAFYGAIIGGAVGSETWTPVYDRRVSLSMASPRDGRRGIGLSLKF